MKWISIKPKLLTATLILFSICFIYQSCQKESLVSPDKTTLRIQKLSEYGIYVGNPSDLIPSTDYKLYELSSQLFTDNAEKQRLIKLPIGTTMSVIDNGLLSFPEGTLIVKTFYYFNDKRNPTLGKKLIETRILELKEGKWIAGTYMWNDAQTDANLISTGLNKTINWIDNTGNGNVISYQIPSNLDCKTCHNSNKNVMPIGPKVHNLNFSVTRNNASVNQLIHLHNEGICDSINPDNYLSLPNYNNASKTLEERGRAYLEINCAHCHNDKGFASKFRYRMNYEVDINTSKIKEGKASIKYMMEKGDMPKIGTTVIDKAGLELIKKYLETL
ncbi:MAG: hypothetical protein V4613_05920 [Bacteroidota bacterium]